MQEMRPRGAAEQRRFLKTADPRALRAAPRALKRRPGRERDDAIAECVAKVWATRVLNVEPGKDSFALVGPSIHRAILRVRYDRRITGRARGFDVFDDRANRKRQQLLIIESTVALRASVRHTGARLGRGRVRLSDAPSLDDSMLIGSPRS